MEIRVVDTALGRHRDEALVLFALEGERILRPVTSAGREFRAGYQTLADRKGFSGEAQQVRILTTGREARVPTLILVGLGKRGELDSEGLRLAAAAGVRAARDGGARSVSLALPQGRGAAFRPQASAEAVVEGSLQGLYRFEAYKAKESETAVEALTVLTSSEKLARAQRGAREGHILGEAICFARSLGNEPGNSATPTYLTAAAQALADEGG